MVYRDVPRYPPVHSDLAFVVDVATPAGDVARAIRESAGELAVSVELFDVFTGDPVPEGHKSLAFSVDLRAPDRTLTDADADAAVGRIVDRLQRDFQAQLRSG